MYNDGVITNEFTGYVSDGEYISPSAKQTATIVFDGWYLSSEDFTTDGLTISSETGESEDITIGNAPAKVLTATMLNPNGLMEGLTWGNGAVYIGVETASATADTYASLPVHVLVGGTHYGINTSGNARRGSTVYTLGGTPVAVISNADGTDVLFITSTKIGRYNGSFSEVSAPTAAQTFLAKKYRALTEPVGIVLDANGCPSVVNDVANNTKTTTTNVPMGVFDFSGVDAHGITFGVEAYDRMTLFDADATDWAASLDFTTAKTLSTILSELMTEMGFSGNYSVSASAVNGSLTYTENPITAYAVTYRQILRWIAEAMGCNVRMNRTGGVELWAWDSTSQETITPYTIISNTRTKARYTVPQITEVVCYDTLGMNYASGSEGVPYYISANPFLTGLDASVAPLTNICTLLRGIPVYYPSVIGQMYADPRLDTGDFVTLQTTDGTAPYAVPVMRQTLHWGGVCEATLVASGNQQRAVPSDLIDNNLATTVNGRKILEGVDAKRITVLDANEDVLFNADADTDEVYIAGFTVENDKFTHSLTQEMSGHDGYNETYTTYVGNYDVQTYYYGYRFPTGETPYQYNDFTSVQHDEIYMVDNDQDNPDYPDNSRIARFTPGMGFFSGEKGAVTIRTKSTGSNPVGFTAPRIGVYYDVANGYGLDLSGGSTSIRAWDGTNSAKMSASDGIVLSDGTYTKTISASGPTAETGSGTTSIASGSYKTLGSIDFPRGTYLIIVNARFPNNATGRREVLLSTSQNSGSAPTEFYLDYRPAVNGNYTNCKFTAVRSFSAASTTMYINAYQNSGGNQSVFYRWLYMRLA